MMTLKLLEVMPDVRAGYGLGSVEERKLCVMAMCSAEDRLRHGEPIGEETDECECVSPVLRTLAISKNDAEWESDEARTAWALDLVPKLLGTRDEVRDVRRAAALARYSVRVIAAKAMRSAGLLEEANRLTTLPEDVPLDIAEVAARAAVKDAKIAVLARAAGAEGAAGAAVDIVLAAQEAKDSLDSARAAQATAESAEAAAEAAQIAQAAAKSAESAKAVIWSTQTATESAKAATRTAQAAAESVAGAEWAAETTSRDTARATVGLDDLLWVAMETA